jgi:hypothetical protein
MIEVNGLSANISSQSGLFTLRPHCKRTPSLLFFLHLFLSIPFFFSLQSLLLELLHPVTHQKMPEAVAADLKSPKTPRRLKTGGEPLRQVHFQSPGTTNGSGIKPTTSASTSTSASASISTTTTSAPFPFSTTISSGEGINVGTAAPDSTSGNNQPESFPQLGAPPNSALGAGQWHTSIDPTQSVKLPGQPFAGGFAPGFTCAPQHAHLVNNPVCSSPFSPLPQLSTPITYIGIPPQHHQHHQHQHLPPHFTTMADYQNAAPMPVGINFQPPVPDTTFGPIPHVYVPRFDGSYVPSAVHVGLPSVQFVSAPAACSTVVMPKTLYYYNGYTYYASRPAAISPLDLLLFAFICFQCFYVFWSNL